MCLNTVFDTFYCVVLGKSLDFSEFQFSHLYSENQYHLPCRGVEQVKNTSCKVQILGVICLYSLQFSDSYYLSWGTASACSYECVARQQWGLEGLLLPTREHPNLCMLVQQAHKGRECRQKSRRDSYHPQGTYQLILKINHENKRQLQSHECYS